MRPRVTRRTIRQTRRRRELREPALACRSSLKNVGFIIGLSIALSGSLVPIQHTIHFCQVAKCLTDVGMKRRLAFDVRARASIARGSVVHSIAAASLRGHGWPGVEIQLHSSK